MKLITYIRQLLKSRSQLDLFLLKGVLLFIVFYLFKAISNKNYGIGLIFDNIKSAMAQLLLYSSKSTVGMLGYDCHVSGRNIHIENSLGVIVANACIGWYLMALFIGFLLIYPSPVKHKLWFIPAGLVIINLLNIIRITTLTIISYTSHQYLAMNHTYIFQIVVYLFIFMMWMFWIVKYGKGKNVNC